MKPRKLLDRVFKGKKVEYDSNAVYTELLSDLSLIEQVKKDRRITDDEAVAAEAEIRLKWKELESELVSFWDSRSNSNQIKAKVVLQKKLKQLHLDEIERKRPSIVVPEPAPVKTLREKIEERRAAAKTKQQARETFDSGKVKNKPNKPDKSGKPDKPKKDK